MSKKAVLTLIIITLFVILIAQTDNILVLGDSKLYFSIDCTINSKYYTKEYAGYTKTLKSYHFKKNEDLGNKIPPRFIKISLPDSLAGDNLEVKKGFYATKVDTILSASFVINNFEIDYWMGNGETKIYFKIPDNFNHTIQNLIIIGENENTLKEIASFAPEICKNTEINDKITELIRNYFYENRNELDRQLTYLYPIADSIKGTPLKEKISSLFDLLNYKISENCYMVIGTSKEYKHHKFLAIVFPNKGKVLIKRHTRFYQSFKIKKEYYFFCHSYYPFTGGNTFRVYRLIENNLETVFIDGSFSM